ncbi:MAG: hypothetical protein QM831_09355 [Kofleriaceae bacterium]
MFRVAALISLLAAPALAEKLSLQRMSAESLHIANNEGAINTDDELSITIDLADKHRVDIIAVGSSKLHNLYRNGRNTDDDIAWTTTWKGTFTRTAKSLAFDLELLKHDCQAQRTENDSAPEPRTCKTPTKHAKVSCLLDSVEIDQKKVAAWRCSPDDKSDLAETQASWLLGKATCIKTLGGHHSPESFELCPASPPAQP